LLIYEKKFGNTISQMKSKIIQRYDHPAQFEPLMPAEAKLGPALEQASDLTRAAAALGSTASAASQSELRALLRRMNSYYTNRLEGEHTRPSEIDRALQQDFSAKPDLARKQRLAVAHIATEAHCEDTIDAKRAEGIDTTRWLYSDEAVLWLHAQLFGSLKPKDLKLPDGTSLVPGAFRTRGVSVGRHEAPTAESTPQFMARWAQVYGKVRRGEASIVAAAASHHRLTWVHPLLDGNGRVARLHTHLLLYSMGLWSPLRGFARSEDRYKAQLQSADEHRRGDLDGRGNLSQQGLLAWIEYTLSVCTEQVEFMSKMLDMKGMRDRIEAALSYEQSAVKSGVRKEVLTSLHYLFATQGELGRADFKAMTGLGERVASQTVSALIDRGFLASDSPYGKVRFAAPAHALRFYFPALWPEAEQDQALLQTEARNQGR
jgi:Fic family protein